jgi:hypothetical protein
VDLEGADGSWLILEVEGGQISGLEIAVWPDVAKRATLVPPAEVEDADVRVPARASQPGIASVEVDTAIAAESDEAERVIYFRLGGARRARTVRVGRQLLLDLDAGRRIVGIWLLDVPPFPSLAPTP